MVEEFHQDLIVLRLDDAVAMSPEMMDTVANSIEMMGSAAVYDRSIKIKV